MVYLTDVTVRKHGYFTIYAMYLFVNFIGVYGVCRLSTEPDCLQTVTVVVDVTHVSELDEANSYLEQITGRSSVVYGISVSQAVDDEVFVYEKVFSHVTNYHTANTSSSIIGLGGFIFSYGTSHVGKAVRNGVPLTVVFISHASFSGCCGVSTRILKR